MKVSKYLNINERDEQAINDFLSHYPPLDEMELLELVKKELPTTNIVKVFCTIVSYHWKRLMKANLLCWDITIHFEERGYVGARVDKYLLGLILNQIYKEFASIQEIRILLDKIEIYLDKKGQRTFSEIIESIKKSQFMRGKHIDFAMLQDKATNEVEDIEKEYERLERLKKYDNDTMENLQRNQELKCYFK